ncbi:hypothetical protein D3C71_1906970 [compost metagenome]
MVRDDIELIANLQIRCLSNRTQFKHPVFLGHSFEYRIFKANDVSKADELKRSGIRLYIGGERFAAAINNG